jgi:hypothetical protein
MLQQIRDQRRSEHPPVMIRSWHRFTVLKHLSIVWWSRTGLQSAVECDSAGRGLTARGSCDAKRWLVLCSTRQVRPTWRRTASTHFFSNTPATALHPAKVGDQNGRTLRICRSRCEGSQINKLNKCTAGAAQTRYSKAAGKKDHASAVRGPSYVIVRYLAHTPQAHLL